MQKIIKWEFEYGFNPAIETKLNSLINEGYKIVNVVPTEYNGNDPKYTFLKRAIIIVEVGRKEKLEKLNSI